MTLHSQLKTNDSKLTPILVAVAIVLITFLIAYYVVKSQDKVLAQILDSQAESTQAKLTNYTADLLADVEAMSERWVNDQGTSEANWRSDAKNIIKKVDGITAMWWINEKFDCEWVVAEDRNSQQICGTLMDESDTVLRLISARETGQSEISKLYQVNDQNTVYIFQPLSGGADFNGYLTAVVNVKTFIDFILGDPLKSGFYTKAYAGKETAYTNGPDLSDHTYLEFFELNMDGDSASWVFKVYPTEASLTMIVSALPKIIGVSGTIIALLFMLTLLSKQKAKNQTVMLANEISEREKVQFELEYLANHDTLTHLPNRHYITNFIENRVKYSKTSQQKFTILFIDLDHFKDINDTLGHAVGDEMLKKLPVLFNKVFRHDDVIARMGGDEFVVFLPGQMSVEHVTGLLERFLKSLETPFQIDEHLIRLTGSVGVAFFPQHGANVTELLSHADAALYRAKDKGRNTFAIYDSEIEQKAKDRVQLIARLHLANEHEEFEMYFQPRYDLLENKIIGAETLIRWKQSANEITEPVGFIGLLEETSLIIPISWRMLKNCCKQFLRLIEMQTDLVMSFNVSARLLEHPDFLVKLVSTLKATGFPPEHLELELTEQTLIQNVENSQFVLNEVSKMGVSIAIDDFGTGYSSLSYLKNFPVDVLKIDKSFIQDIDSDSDDLELVKTMISMGKNLRIITVAEGVENEAQLNLLKLEKCDQVQGYYFTRPMQYYDFYQLIDDGEVS